MPLATPRLDDRHFQDIVDEAKKRIPHYVKEWTDHNVSDPGITLIELFAWMTDIILYRLNQVPDLHTIKFMEMLGIRLREPVPAKAPVTFWLSAPQPTPVVIPAGTEVASTQTETERSIVFTTDADFTVRPPSLAAVLTRVAAGSGQEKQYRDHNLRRLDAGFEGFDVFSPVPQVDDAFYFGLENDLSHHVLGLELDCDPAGGAGIDPTLPPYLWEVSTGEKEVRWRPCDVEMDTTKGLNIAGRIRLHLPQMGKYSVNKKELYWVRLRIKEIQPDEAKEGMRPYLVSPRLRQLSAASWGGATMATHAEKVSREFLGRSDGSAGQRFQLQRTPILKRQPDERLVVQVEGEPPQQWTELPDFADSGANDRHYTLDSVGGDLRFGPAVRQQDGTIKLYGAVPPRGANLVFEKYRYGGGQEGNVQAGILNTLKTSIPFIARVSNRRPAWGGLDAETLESAMMRAPALLRSRGRAVTESDFEFLARQALPAAIGRVKCLQPRPAEAGRVAPGQVYVLVIPRVTQPARYLEPAELEPKAEDVASLSAYLDERRLLTTRLDIRAPAYRWVAAKVQLRAAPGVPPEAVQADVLARLYRYLNPITGGPNGEGWPFGRELFLSDVYQCLQGVPNVQFIRNVEMRAAQPGGRGEGNPVESLEVVAHGVIASAVHEVEFV
ncbi:MAG: putative baseplate assembly protein [Chloroflexi bacterium]|nr:putative baseplate assembly protein [Chloroflexota bacterium]MCI0574681.1 putative baseplate assembly protein [Chloroflexota bacterium]MCI0647426.1 putative baseplate assembly protein [Chloroflexota bacterium]MCI0726866.1 putative baseplate assembly protein [Chloroflexota bacterium]